jgi:hypothetical protein
MERPENVDYKWKRKGGKGKSRKRWVSHYGCKSGSRALKSHQYRET